MTWDQFKTFVDQKVKEAGHDGSVPLAYIKYVSNGRARIDVGIGKEVDDVQLQVWNA